MRGFVTSAILVFCLSAAAYAAPHRPRVHPNSSFTIFAIAEGPDGLLWLATSDGLYRFDGFHYHKITAYPFSFARFLAFTRDKSLWGAGYEGLARALPGRQFEVLSTQEVYGLAVYPDQLFILMGGGLTQVRLDGSVRHLGHRLRRDLMIDSSNKLWSVCLQPPAPCWIDPGRPEVLHTLNSPENFQTAIRDDHGRLWVSNDEEGIAFEKGRPVIKLRRQPSLERRRSGPLLAGSSGRLWFLGDVARELNSGIEFRDRAGNDRFHPTAGFEDSQGRLWIASLGLGLVEWAQDTQWRRWFPEDLANEAPVQVVRDAQGSLVLSTHKHLYRWNQKTEKWVAFTSAEYQYDGLLPLDEGGFLASLRNIGVVRIAPDGRIAEKLKDLVSPLEQYREIIRDGKGRMWVGTKRALLRIEGRPGSLLLREEDLPGEPFNDNEQAVDLELDAAGRLWVGHQNGIAWLDDQDHWHAIETSQPVTMVRSFALAGDDIWVAYRRAGTFSRLRKSGAVWQVTAYSANAGYGPADTNFLKRDSRGWIWRGTSDGVYIADGRRFGPNDWLRLNMRNGLAANESENYGFLEDIDGTVWVAGAEGLTNFRPDATWFQAPADAPPPRITRVQVDGNVFLYPTAMPQEIATSTRILRFDVGTLHASPFRDVPLRYRLLSGEWANRPEWRLSGSGTLEFSSLPQREFTLEVGYSGDGPSRVAAFAFRVGRARTAVSWIWVVAPLMAAGSLVLIVRFVPWFEGPRFKIEKALFVLRRRYSRRDFGTSSELGLSRDYSGQTLAGRYHVTRVISRGGFSVVYEARDLREQSARLAVKVLNRATGEDSWVRDRFAHEVAALQSVRHPGVVRILDSWISAAGEPCLAMPFLEGLTLRAALNNGPVTARRAARIVRQLAPVLCEVHRHGIVHRDLKPENLMLLEPGTEREQCVVVDFGTAGLRSADNELAATTLMAGSFHYMAPERLTGHYSPASDVFSFGVIILEMLTGKRLVDLKAMYSDPLFHHELKMALRTTLGDSAAGALADRLAPAFHTEPRSRPDSVEKWAEEIAEAIGAKQQ